MDLEEKAKKMTMAAALVKLGENLKKQYALQNEAANIRKEIHAQYPPIGGGKPEKWFYSKTEMQ